MKSIVKTSLAALLLTGCAGFSRSCSSNTAETFGANWIVVQRNSLGLSIKCWKLPNTSIANEPASDGIFWKSPSGHLVHISGWYNRVQVSGDDYEGAANELGINLADCK